MKTDVKKLLKRPDPSPENRQIMLKEEDTLSDDSIPKNIKSASNVKNSEDN